MEEYLGGSIETLSVVLRQKPEDWIEQAEIFENGPYAKHLDYIVKDKFDESGIKLTWMDYDGYPEYPQLYGEFVHKVSILDVLFNCGKQSINFI